MTDKILLRHSISRHQSLSVKLRGAYHGCVGSRAMPHSVKFKSKIFLPTPRYAAQWGVDSALCRKAESRDMFANFSANSQPYAKLF
jgi:hypothetical protein